MVEGSSVPLGVGGAVALVCEEGIWITMAGGEDDAIVIALLSFGFLRVIWSVLELLI